MKWYQPQWWYAPQRMWYVERPFPWLAIVAVATPILIIMFALILGAFWPH